MKLESKKLMKLDNKTESETCTGIESETKT